jgi:hypothetical protein
MPAGTKVLPPPTTPTVQSMVMVFTNWTHPRVAPSHPASLPPALPQLLNAKITTGTAMKDATRRKSKTR